MTPARSAIELHCHSTASDGLLTPAQLVQLALDRGLTALALTDHDTLEGLEPARSAAQGQGLEVLSGVELSCRFRQRNFHLLGYLFDAHDPGLLSLTRGLRQQRQARMGEMLDRLDKLGIQLDRQPLLQGNPGRAHLARALVGAGLVKDQEEAFARWLGQGKKAYVAGRALGPEEAIEALHAAGGLAVLAHPGLNSAECLLDQLTRAGLDGMEVYYPRHPRATLERLEREALRLGLVATGGSDYHGPESPQTAGLGSVWLPPETLERLRACSRIRNSNAT